MNQQTPCIELIISEKKDVMTSTHQNRVAQLIFPIFSPVIPSVQTDFFFLSNVIRRLCRAYFWSDISKKRFRVFFIAPSLYILIFSFPQFYPLTAYSSIQTLVRRTGTYRDVYTIHKFVEYSLLSKTFLLVIRSRMSI